MAASRAGRGVDRTQPATRADPLITRTMQERHVESEAAHFSMKIASLPSENPRTGKITAQSVMALLRTMGAQCAIGT